MREIGGAGSGKWELRAYLGRDPVTRRPRQKSKVVHGGKRKAEDALREFVREVERGRFRSTEGTVSHLLNEYLDHLVARGASPYTLATWTVVIRNHLDPALGHLKLSELERGHIAAYYRGLAGKLAPSTITLHHQVLNAALRLAIEWEWLTVNPAMRVPRPKAERADPTPPSPSEVRSLIVEAERRNPSMAAFVFVAATTGARRGEMCALRESAVDLANASLTISGSVVDHGGGKLSVKGTKSDRARRLALDAATVTVLARHIQAQAEGVQRAADPFLFSNDPAGSRPLSPGTASQWFIRLRNDLGLQHVKLHHLRHFMATQALGAGNDIRTVSGRLGHADPAITMRVYQHFMPELDRKVADQMGALLTSPTVPEDGGH